MPDTFNGSEGAPIGIVDAATLTQKYRTENPGKTKAHFFGREHIKALLDQEGAMGIRIYYGIDKFDQPQLVLCAADENQDDMLDLLMDFSVPCPDRCGATNDLNSDPN